MLHNIRSRRFVAILIGIALIVWSTPVPAEMAPQGDVAVIAHPDVPMTDLTRTDLRRMLLGDREFWAPGLRVTLFIRAPIARERDAAVQDV